MSSCRRSPERPLASGAFTYLVPVHVYLAEGATSAFFDTRLALLNPGPLARDGHADVRPRWGRAPWSTRCRCPRARGVTVDPKTVAEMATAEFSTAVGSDQPLIVDRTLRGPWPRATVRTRRRASRRRP